MRLGVRSPKSAAPERRMTTPRWVCQLCSTAARSTGSQVARWQPQKDNRRSIAAVEHRSGRVRPPPPRHWSDVPGWGAGIDDRYRSPPAALERCSKVNGLKRWRGGQAEGTRGKDQLKMVADTGRSSRTSRASQTQFHACRTSCRNRPICPQGGSVGLDRVHD
jgi:hypothetical protein